MEWYLALILLLGTVFGAATLVRAGTGNGKADTLSAVTLLFRHGAISPKYGPPKVETDRPMGFKQLIAVSMRDMWERGQALR